MLTRHTFHIFIFQFPSWIRTKYTPSRQHTWTCNFVEYICLVSLDIDLLFDIFRMDKLFFFLYYISFQILTCFNFTSTENITTSKYVHRKYYNFKIRPQKILQLQNFLWNAESIGDNFDKKYIY